MGARVGKGLSGLGLAVVPGVGVTPTPSILPGMAVGINNGEVVGALGLPGVGLPGLGLLGLLTSEGEGLGTDVTGGHSGTLQHESLGSVTRVQPAARSKRGHLHTHTHTHTHSIQT